MARSRDVYVFFGLCTMPAIHLVATSIEVALGGHPAQWFYPPVRPEHVLALVFFSVGEEFGWRGYAYRRMAERHGPVLGSLLLGVAWTLWHFVMWFTPDGPPGARTLLAGVIELSLGSVVFAWAFEKSGRSMAVAIALHMSAHLDNTMRAPEGEVRLRVLRLVVLGVAAFFAGRALRRVPPLHPSSLPA